MNGCCYNLFMTPFEKAALGLAREELLRDLSGRVVEVGCGTGVNFGLYPEPEKVLALEPDEEMRRVAESVRPPGLDLRQGLAEAIPVPDASVDHLVVTLVFCSVESLMQSLLEARRVLKPEGTLHFLEHVKGDGIYGRLHDWCTPLWSRIAGGCHLNRETVSVLTEAGFEVIELREVLRFIGTPFVMGRARAC